MSRLDDIEARLAALEAGAASSLEVRITTVEGVLGLNSREFQGVFPAGAKMMLCSRCGNTQNINDFRCAQTKCPLKQP